MDFKDKVTLITGASRGIGKAIAIEFAKLGSNIVINYNNSRELALELEDYIKTNYKVKVLSIKADVSLEEEVNNMVAKVINKFGCIDILVNNAGIALDSIMENKTKDTFRQILDTNLIGTFLTCKYVSKHMKERKMGKIINMASTNGIDTLYPYSMDYDASKAGVISLTKNMAIELSPYIQVNCICPGWVNTEMNKQLDASFIQQECNKILLHRFADVSEIAKVVVFLASDSASYINGSIIRVDGGFKP